MGRKSHNPESGAKSGKIFLVVFAAIWNIFIGLAFIGVVVDNPHDIKGMLILAPFLLVGVFLGFLAFNPKILNRISSSQYQSGLPHLVDAPDARNRSGHVELKPKVSPMGKLIGMACMALFWNGIVSVFIFQLFKEFQKGHLDWFLTLFLTPFVLVGIGFICGVVYFLLALTNPRPLLKVKSTKVKPGETFNIEWQFSGNADKIKNFRVYLEGREEATYTRGTTTTTDKSVFATIELTKEQRASSIRRGNVKCTIPEDTMHSFMAPSNKVVWNVCIHGDIPKWPDVKEEFEISVIPFEEKDLRRLSYD